MTTTNRTQVLNIFGMTLAEAKKIVADVPCDDCAVLPFEGAKHPAWLIGHLIEGVNFAGQLLGVDAGVPEAWAPLYAPGTEPESDRAKYPTKDELMSVFESSHAVVAEAYANAPQETLEKPFPMENYREFWPTVGDGLFYLLAYHEGYHLGQLTAWRRATGRGPAQG